MFGFDSDVIEVVIGVLLVYLLVSLICATVMEFIADRLKLRSRDLEKGIHSLLTDQAVRQVVLMHPLMQRLTKPGDTGLPSYVPARTFALAVMNVAKGTGTFTSSTVANMAALRSGLAGLPPELQMTLEDLLADAGTDFNKARQEIEKWFDDAMDRVTGWYKKRAQYIVMAIALPVIVALNADTLTVANSLWQNSILREAAADLGGKVVEEADTPDDDTTREVREGLSELNILGWRARSGDYEDPREVPKDVEGWLIKAGGLLITWAAVYQGAPFWFDMLKKFVNVRNAGKPPAPTNAPT